MPCQGSRKATVNAPALGELTSGVAYALQVSPLSLVARTRAVVEPPVAIHALFPPCVATQVPLAANDASPGKAGGMLLPDVLPRHSIGRAEIGEDSVHRVAVRDAPQGSPEREAVVERTGVLVLELHRPRRATIHRLINSEIAGVRSNRRQIRHFFAYALHISELQGFGARHHTGLPGFSSIGSDHKRATSP